MNLILIYKRYFDEKIDKEITPLMKY